MSNVEQIVAAFQDEMRKILHYQEALELLEWDLRTGAPKRGVPLRAEAIGTLSGEIFDRVTSDQMAEYLQELSDPSVYPTLTPVLQASVQEMKRQADWIRKIPRSRYKQYVTLTREAESVWEDAKQDDDFARFQPYLERIVDMNIEFAGYRGGEGNPYDALLDHYEPGVTVAQLDAVFTPLRKELTELAQRIAASGHRPDVRPLLRPVAKSTQREVCEAMLGVLGFDFSAGRLDETVHPFQITLNHYDVRVTTHYREEDLRVALFGVMHECGHALYEQGVSETLVGTPLCGGVSMGIHESQSLFFENIIGRSRAFWEANYGWLQQRVDTLADVSLNAFYAAINDVHPSLIRIEADEVTYPLHIIVRYELEKALINGQLSVRDLPEAWRHKMQEYLGVAPDTDRDGVLQDVHWSAGLIGYFPSYALGYIYSAQFRHALLQQMPDFEERLQSGRVTDVRDWLREQIHRHGKLRTPGELVQSVTGEAMNPTYLLNYLYEKYTPLYAL
ncbi:carboxypeptidase M32 [Alicyclobacillus contaminans]|uniref:carboxypeptidase M32 n=1 Tax=Alicyclobacillus contaminans TaxID=392016 RepID=UPI00316AC4A4